MPPNGCLVRKQINRTNKSRHPIHEDLFIFMTYHVLVPWAPSSWVPYRQNLGQNMYFLLFQHQIFISHCRASILYYYVSGYGLRFVV